MISGLSPNELDHERVFLILNKFGDQEILGFCDRYFKKEFLRSVWAISGRYEGELANFLIQQLMKSPNSRLPEFSETFSHILNSSSEMKIFAKLLASVINLPVAGEIMLKNFDMSISLFNTQLPICDILLDQELSPRYFQLLIKLYFPTIFSKKSGWLDPQLPTNPGLDEVFEEILVSSFFAKLAHRMLHIPIRVKLFDEWLSSDKKWFSPIIMAAVLHIGQTRIGKNYQQLKNAYRSTKIDHFIFRCVVDHIFQVKCCLIFLAFSFFIILVQLNGYKVSRGIRARSNNRLPSCRLINVF